MPRVVRPRPCWSLKIQGTLAGVSFSISGMLTSINMCPALSPVNNLSSCQSRTPGAPCPRTPGSSAGPGPRGPPPSCSGRAPGDSLAPPASFPLHQTPFPEDSHENLDPGIHFNEHYFLLLLSNDLVNLERPIVFLCLLFAKMCKISENINF